MIEINKQNLQNEMITTQKLMKEINVSPSLPNEKIRASQLEKILNEIEVGQKWENYLNIKLLLYC